MGLVLKYIVMAALGRVWLSNDPVMGLPCERLVVM